MTDWEAGQSFKNGLAHSEKLPFPLLCPPVVPLIVPGTWWPCSQSKGHSLSFESHSALRTPPPSSVPSQDALPWWTYSPVPSFVAVCTSGSHVWPVRMLNLFQCWCRYLGVYKLKYAWSSITFLLCLASIYTAYGHLNYTRKIRVHTLYFRSVSSIVSTMP